MVDPLHKEELDSHRWNYGVVAVIPTTNDTKGEYRASELYTSRGILSKWLSLDVVA
jgi:hypothetical protein